MALNEEPEEIVDLDTVDEEIEQRYKDLMELNAGMQERAADQARALLRSADLFDEMSERARAAATLMYVTAQQLTQNAGDLLTSEFGLDIQHAEGPDDSEDDDE